MLPRGWSKLRGSDEKGKGRIGQSGHQGDPFRVKGIMRKRKEIRSICMPDTSLYRTWLEIDRAAIKKNLVSIKAKIPARTKFLAMVKGNAWGMGTVPYGGCLVEAGTDWLGVTNAEDALCLRKEHSQIPILIVCEVWESWLEELLRKDIRLTVCTSEMAAAVSQVAAKLKCPAKVHIKINTGLNRIGVAPEKAVDLMKEAAEMPNLDLEGAFTHYSSASQLGNKETEKQLNIFLELIDQAKQAGINFKILHTANTPATVALPQTHLDMVRVGMGIAGLYPAEEFRQIIKLVFPLTWKTRISYIRDIRAGERVGYGGRYQAPGPATLVTIPVGFADGLSKKFAGQGSVLIRGEKHKVVAVSMDQAMIALPVCNGLQVGQEVVILGKQQQGCLDPHFTAGQIGIDVEELLTHISVKHPRVYLD